jgi:hypothetical protein
MKGGVKAASRRWEKSQRDCGNVCKTRITIILFCQRMNMAACFLLQWGAGEGIGGLTNAFSPAHALSGWYEIYC